MTSSKYWKMSYLISRINICLKNNMIQTTDAWPQTFILYLEWHAESLQSDVSACAVKTPYELQDTWDIWRGNGRNWMLFPEFYNHFQGYLISFPNFEFQQNITSNMELLHLPEWIVEFPQIHDARWCCLLSGLLPQKVPFCEMHVKSILTEDTKREQAIIHISVHYAIFNNWIR